jgi:hypothetical protein
VSDCSPPTELPPLVGAIESLTWDGKRNHDPGTAAVTSRSAGDSVRGSVEHIYAKLGVSSCAAATLYATQHSLMGTFESAG